MVSNIVAPPGVMRHRRQLLLSVTVDGTAFPIG